MEDLLNTFGMMYPYTLIFMIILMAIYYRRTYRQVNTSLLPLFLFFALLAYFLSFFGNYTTQWFMILWFIRDLATLLICIWIWKIFLRFPKSVFIGILILVAGSVYLYFRNGSVSFNKVVTEYASNNGAELIFEIKDVKYKGKVDTLLASFKPKIEQAFPQLNDTATTTLDNCFTIDINDSSFIDRMIDTLNKSGYVEWVEYNEAYKLSPVEDSLGNIGQKDYLTKVLNDTFVKNQWGFGFMDIENLMATLKKVKPVKRAKIFILDTGVDGKHEDLSDNYISLNEKYDTDTDKHGTHCAGIACAVSNNQKGIASLNLTGKLTSITGITVLPGGYGRQEGIIDGIVLAADNGADVISMSLGGVSNDKRQIAYEKAIQYANSKGAVVVVAAGNENDNAKNHVPASCKGVICVSAVDDSLKKAVFSNFVTDIEFKVAAPGVNIFSTLPLNQYKAMNGTSMATPYVAGLAGIMKSLEPSLNTEDIYRMLMATGIDTKNTNLTGKFIQPLKAVSEIKSLSFGSRFTLFMHKLLVFKEN
ncbi:MAG: S8 family serine peptidase [Bacteroidales bacterium]